VNRTAELTAAAAAAPDMHRVRTGYVAQRVPLPLPLPLPLSRHAQGMHRVCHVRDRWTGGAEGGLVAGGLTGCNSQGATHRGTAVHSTHTQHTTHSTQHTARSAQHTHSTQYTILSEGVLSLRGLFSLRGYSL
jgi:hypothetical protein